MIYSKYDKLKISHTVFIIFNAKCKKKIFLFCYTFQFNTLSTKIPQLFFF